jgi:phosphatidylserine/phosphatidylglycerophosphate/cardiolipin synthase-like enzyme
MRRTEEVLPLLLTTLFLGAAFLIHCKNIENELTPDAERLAPKAAMSAGLLDADTASAPSCNTFLPFPNTCKEGEWSAHFSPNGGCEQAVASLIESAQVGVYMLAYGFTSEKIATALIERKALGLNVFVVLDKSDKTAKNSMLLALRRGNVDVSIDSKHAIAHNKVIIVDGEWVETGSFNYTQAAEHSNSENCLIEHASDKAKLYMSNWYHHNSHSDVVGPM